MFQFVFEILNYFFLGLVQGEITVQNLVQQLQNPANTRRHQELLLSILKSQSHKGGDFMGKL